MKPQAKRHAPERLKLERKHASELRMKHAKEARFREAEVEATSLCDGRHPSREGVWYHK